MKMKQNKDGVIGPATVLVAQFQTHYTYIANYNATKKRRTNEARAFHRPHPKTDQDDFYSTRSIPRHTVTKGAYVHNKKKGNLPQYYLPVHT